MDINKRIAEIYPKLVEMRREFHMHPELSQQEFRTGDKIRQYLSDWGIAHTAGVAETGIVGIIYGQGQSAGQEKRTVALRADMDALPIEEANRGASYCSQKPGVMHACGHDAHIAIQLGAVRILKDMEDMLPGNVKFFFQPAEETIGGAKRMIAEGCLKNPDVDYIIGLHVMPGQETGWLEMKYGKLNASSDELDITIQGKAAHGASPHCGVDAIVIAANVVAALQTVVSRSVSPLNNVALSFGTVRGGTAVNVICDEVKLGGTLRTVDWATRDSVISIIRRQVEHITKAYGGEGIVKIQEDGYAALVNDDEVMDIAVRTAGEVVGAGHISYKEFPSMGVEDFSFFLQEVPGCFYHLGCGNSEKGITAPLHSGSFDIDERCLEIGTRMQVELALALLNDDHTRR